MPTTAITECTCDARFSRINDAEWLARGAPSCVCGIIKRWLLYHPESESLFEVFKEEEMKSYLDDGLTLDVTDEERFEERFRIENEA